MVAKSEASSVPELSVSRTLNKLLSWFCDSEWSGISATAMLCCRSALLVFDRIADLMPVKARTGIRSQRVMHRRRSQEKNAIVAYQQLFAAKEQYKEKAKAEGEKLEKREENKKTQEAGKVPFHPPS